ncbi:AP2 domain transcription factor AP2X-8 [Toxoplasma gondii GT1]|uniref:AP2 domain transcription factor AP2X-8 n=1 Tax=Toxoplasma gondii (strain ATCC 50853 / GT1) TaxID=507601 RepID=S7URI0_TOXGG|nr:AP2 domain transcription factor AP2X-8 [Toxoplasma gondii GT1]
MDVERGESPGDSRGSVAFLHHMEKLERLPGTGETTIRGMSVTPPYICMERPPRANCEALRLKSPPENRAFSSRSESPSPTPFARECASLGLVWGDEGTRAGLLRTRLFTPPDHTPHLLAETRASCLEDLFPGTVPQLLSHLPSPPPVPGVARASRSSSPLAGGSSLACASPWPRSATPFFAANMPALLPGRGPMRVTKWLDGQVSDPQSDSCLRGGASRVERAAALLCGRSEEEQERERSVDERRLRKAIGVTDEDESERERETEGGVHERLSRCAAATAADRANNLLGLGVERGPEVAGGRLGGYWTTESEVYPQRIGELEGEGLGSPDPVAASALVTAVQDSRENLNCLTGVLTTLRLSSRDSEGDFDLPLFVQSRKWRAKYNRRSLDLKRTVARSKALGYPAGVQIPETYRDLKNCMQRPPSIDAADSRAWRSAEAPRVAKKIFSEGRRATDRDEQVAFVEDEVTEQLLFNANAAVEGTTLYNNLLCKYGLETRCFSTSSAPGNTAFESRLARSDADPTASSQSASALSHAAVSPSLASALPVSSLLLEDAADAVGDRSELETGSQAEAAIPTSEASCMRREKHVGEESRADKGAFLRRASDSTHAEEDGLSGGKDASSREGGSEEREEAAHEAADSLWSLVLNRNIAALPGLMTVGRYECDLLPKRSAFSRKQLAGLVAGSRPLPVLPSSSDTPGSASTELLAERVACALTLDEGEAWNPSDASDLDDFLESSCAPNALRRGRQAVAPVRGARRRRGADLGLSPPPSSPAVRCRSLVRWSQQRPFFSNVSACAGAADSRREEWKDAGKVAKPGSESAWASRDLHASTGLVNAALDSSEQKSGERESSLSPQERILTQVKKELEDERVREKQTIRDKDSEKGQAGESNHHMPGTANGQRTPNEGEAPMETEEASTLEPSNGMHRDGQDAGARMHSSSTRVLEGAVEDEPKVTLPDKDEPHASALCGEREKQRQSFFSSVSSREDAQDEDSRWCVAGGMYNGWKGTYDVWIYRRVSAALREGKGEEEKRREGEKRKTGKGKQSVHTASLGAGGAQGPSPGETQASGLASGSTPLGSAGTLSAGRNGEETCESTGSPAGAFASSSSLAAKGQNGHASVEDLKTQKEESLGCVLSASALPLNPHSGETREDSAGRDEEKGEERERNENEPPLYEWRVKRFSALILGHEKASRLACKYCVYLERFGRIRGRLSICSTCCRDACSGCMPSKKRAAGADFSPHCRNGRDAGVGGAGRAPKRRVQAKKGAAGAAGVCGDRARKGKGEDEPERDGLDRREEGGTPSSKQTAERRGAAKKEGREEDDRVDGKGTSLSLENNSFESSCPAMRSSLRASFEVKGPLSPSSADDRPNEGAAGRGAPPGSEGPSRDLALRSHSFSSASSSRKSAKNAAESLRRIAGPLFRSSGDLTASQLGAEIEESDVLQDVFELYSEAGEAWETCTTPVSFSPSLSVASRDTLVVLGGSQTTAVARLDSGKMSEAVRRSSNALSAAASSFPKGKGFGGASKKTDSVTLSFLARVCRNLRMFLLLCQHNTVAGGLPGDSKSVCRAQSGPGGAGLAGADGRAPGDLGDSKGTAVARGPVGAAGRAHGSEPWASPNYTGGPFFPPAGSAPSGWPPVAQANSRPEVLSAIQGAQGQGPHTAHSLRLAASLSPAQTTSESFLAPESFAAGVRPLLEGSLSVLIPEEPQVGLGPSAGQQLASSSLSPGVSVKAEPSSYFQSAQGTCRDVSAGARTAMPSSFREQGRPGAAPGHAPSGVGRCPPQGRDASPGCPGFRTPPAGFDGPSSSGAGYSLSPYGYPGTEISPHLAPFFPEPYRRFRESRGGPAWIHSPGSVDVPSSGLQSPFTGFHATSGSSPPRLGPSEGASFAEASPRALAGDLGPAGFLGASVGAPPAEGRGPLFDPSAEGEGKFAPDAGALGTVEGPADCRTQGETGRTADEDEKKKAKKAKKHGRITDIEERLAREEPYDVVEEGDDPEPTRQLGLEATEKEQDVPRSGDSKSPDQDSPGQPADIMHGYFKARVRNRRVKDGLLLRMTAVLVGKGFYDLETVEPGAPRRRGGWGESGEEEEESETKYLFSNPASQKPCDFILYFDTRENRDASVAILNQALPAPPPRLPPKNGESQARRTLRQLYDHFLEPKCQCLEDKTLKVKHGVINLLGFPRLYVKLHCSMSWDERLSLFSSFLHWLCREDDSQPPPWSSPELHPELLAYLVDLGRKGFASGGAATTAVVNAPDLPLDDSALSKKNAALIRAYMQQDTGASGPSGSVGATSSDPEAPRKDDEAEEGEKDDSNAALVEGPAPETSGDSTGAAQRCGKGREEREAGDKRGPGNEGCGKGDGFGSPVAVAGTTAAPGETESVSCPSSTSGGGASSALSSGPSDSAAAPDGCESSPVALESASLLSFSPSAARAEVLTVPGVGLVNFSLPDGVKFDKSKLAFRCYWREGHAGVVTVGAGAAVSPSSGAGTFVPSRPTVCTAQNKSRTFSCRKYGLYQSRVLALQARLLSELLWPQPPSPARLRVSAMAAVVYGLIAAPMPFTDPWQAVCGVSVAEDALRQRREVWKNLLDPRQRRPAPAPISQLSLPPVSGPPHASGPTQELPNRPGTPWPGQETVCGARGPAPGLASAWATYGNPGDRDATEPQSTYVGRGPAGAEGPGGGIAVHREWARNSGSEAAQPCQFGRAVERPVPGPQSSLGPGGDNRGDHMAYDQSPAGPASNAPGPTPPFVGPFSPGLVLRHGPPAFSQDPSLHWPPFAAGTGPAGQRLASDSPYPLKNEASPQLAMAHAPGFEKSDGFQGEQPLAKQRKIEGASDRPVPDEGQVVGTISHGKSPAARPVDGGFAPDGRSPLFSQDASGVGGGRPSGVGGQLAAGGKGHFATAPFGSGTLPTTRGPSQPGGDGLSHRSGTEPAAAYSSPAGAAYPSASNASPIYGAAPKREGDSPFGPAPPSGYCRPGSPAVDPKLPGSVPSSGNLDSVNYGSFFPGQQAPQGDGRIAPWGSGHVGAPRGEARGSERVVHAGASRGLTGHELEEGQGGPGEEGAGRERQRKRRKSAMSMSSQGENTPLFAPTSLPPVPFASGDSLADGSGSDFGQQLGPPFSHGSHAPPFPEANAVGSQHFTADNLETPGLPAELGGGDGRRQSGSTHEEVSGPRAGGEKGEFSLEGAPQAAAQQLSAETLTFLLGTNVVWEENEKRWRVQVRPPSPRGCDGEGADGKLGGEKKKRKRDGFSAGGERRRSSTGNEPDDQHKAGTLEWVSMAQLHQAQKLQNQLVGKMERGKGEGGDEERLGGDGRGNIFFDANGSDENAKKAALLKARRWLRRRIVQGQILVTGLSRDGLFSSRPDEPERSSSVSTGAFTGSSPNDKPTDLNAAVPPLSPFFSPIPFGATTAPHRPSPGFYPPAPAHPTEDGCRPPMPAPVPMHAPQGPVDSRTYRGARPVYPGFDVTPQTCHGVRPESMQEEGRAALLAEQGSAFFVSGDGKGDNRGATVGQIRQGTVRVMQSQTASQSLDQGFDLPHPPTPGPAYRGVPVGHGPSGPYYLNGGCVAQRPYATFSNLAGPVQGSFPPLEFSNGGLPTTALGRRGSDSGPQGAGRNASQMQPGFASRPHGPERLGRESAPQSGAPPGFSPHAPGRGERDRPSFSGATTMPLANLTAFSQPAAGPMFVGTEGRGQQGDIHPNLCGVAPVGGPRGPAHAPMPAYGPGGAAGPPRDDRRAEGGAPGVSHSDIFLANDRRLHPEMCLHSAPSWGPAGTFASPDNRQNVEPWPAAHASSNNFFDYTGVNIPAAGPPIQLDWSKVRGAGG